MLEVRTAALELGLMVESLHPEAVRLLVPELADPRDGWLFVRLVSHADGLDADEAVQLRRPLLALQEARWPQNTGRPERSPNVEERMVWLANAVEAVDVAIAWAQETD